MHDAEVDPTATSGATFNLDMGMVRAQLASISRQMLKSA
jgi:hypothetical protein